jgi:TRAP-type C4-dicarboxylate transport system permease small subunit
MNPDGDGADETRAGLLGRFVELPVRLGGVLATLLILLLLGLIAYAVAQRYLFNTPLLWSDELTGYLLVALIMFGTSEAYRRGDHISIDLVTGSAGPRLARIIGVWSDLAVLVFAVVLGWSAWEAISFARAFGSYSAGQIEIATWIPQIPLLIGAALLGLTALSRLLGRFA